MTLTSGGEDLTPNYTFDPRVGFKLFHSGLSSSKVPSSKPPDFTSVTCHLAYLSKRESLQFRVRSQQLVNRQSTTAPILVTLKTGEEVVEGWGEIAVDCKVEADGEVEVEWEVPALPFHRLLMFLIRIYCSLTTGSIQASRLFVSQRDLMSRK